MAEIKIERNTKIENDYVIIIFKINDCDNIEELHNYLNFDIDNEILIQEYSDFIEYLEDENMIIENDYPFLHFKVEKCKNVIKEFTQEFISKIRYILKESKLIDRKIIIEKTIEIDERYIHTIIIERCVEDEPSGYAVWFEINGKNSLSDLYESLKLSSIDKNKLENDVFEIMKEIEKNNNYIIGYKFPYYCFKIKNKKYIKNLTELFVTKFCKLLDDYENVNKKQDLCKWLYKSYEVILDI